MSLSSQNAFVIAQVWSRDFCNFAHVNKMECNGSRIWGHRRCAKPLNLRTTSLWTLRCHKPAIPVATFLSSGIFLAHKRSMGHDFTACMNTEYQNEMALGPCFSAFHHEISALIELRKIPTWLCGIRTPSNCKSRRLPHRCATVLVECQLQIPHQQLPRNPQIWQCLHNSFTPV